MWIMIAGPYKSGTKNILEQEENLRQLNLVAYLVLKKGHIPIIGVNLALPIIKSVGEERYDEIMMPLSLQLIDKCEAILRVGGASSGADQEVDKFKKTGKIIFHNLDDIPFTTN